MAQPEQVREQVRQQVAQQEQAPEAPTVYSLLEGMRSQLVRALPEHTNPDRFIRTAMTAVRQTPDLLKCSPESLRGAVMTCAQLGLYPGPLGHAYLVPKRGQVTFIPGYKGLIQLAVQGGVVQHVSARPVHDRDLFEYEYGTEEHLTHRPVLNGDPGPVIGYYSLARFKDRTASFHVMSAAEVLKIRDRYAGRNAQKEVVGPWASDLDAMGTKSAVRAHFKWLPSSTERLDAALIQDGAVRTRVDTSVLDLADAPEAQDD